MKKKWEGQGCAQIPASVLILVPNCWFHRLQGSRHRWSRVGAYWCYQELPLQRHLVRTGMFTVTSSCRWGHQPGQLERKGYLGFYSSHHIANGQLLPGNNLVPFSLSLFKCIFIDCSTPLNLISSQVSFSKARTLLYEVHKRLYLFIIYYLPSYLRICCRKEGRMEGKKTGIDFCESSISSII